jgi:hypothetical protein
MSKGSEALPVIDSNTSCFFFNFGLIVTGEGERDHLDKLFRVLMDTGVCNFKVLHFTGQLRPITSIVRKQKMVGTGKTIPTKDEEQIGLPARRYLDEDKCRFVILIDDLEHDWRAQAQAIFQRYRLAFDTILYPEQRQRAAVHLLVNMLEAYYFGDAQAVNNALALNPSIQDYPDDVENISNPKAELKRIYPQFNERRDGGQILDRLDVEHVLSRPHTCAWLRTLFAWCVKVLSQYPVGPLISNERFRISDGVLSDVTRVQLDNL